MKEKKRRKLKEKLKQRKAKSKKFYFLLNLILLLECSFQPIRPNLMKLKFELRFVLENPKSFELRAKRKLELKIKGGKE
jgi:hypothetical protein